MFKGFIITWLCIRIFVVLLILPSRSESVEESEEMVEMAAVLFALLV